MDKNTRAERIIEQDPNGLVVLDHNLLIVDHNTAFLHIFGIDPSEEIIGRNVNQVLEQVIFPDADIVQERNKVKFHKKTGNYVEPVTFSLEMDDLNACFFVDITTHYLADQRMKELKQETIKKAHDVIDRQMLVAQEIASLLGETTAESKVQLLRLIKLLEEENEIRDER